MNSNVESKSGFLSSGKAREEKGKDGSVAECKVLLYSVSFTSVLIFLGFFSVVAKLFELIFEYLCSPDA